MQHMCTMEQTQDTVTQSILWDGYAFSDQLIACKDIINCTVNIQTNVYEQQGIYRPLYLEFSVTHLFKSKHMFCMYSWDTK